MTPCIAMLSRFTLVNDTLSALLSNAGFAVFRQHRPPDRDTVVVIDFDDCLDSDGIGAHQQRGDKIVVLATEADTLTMSEDQLAPLSGLLTDDLSADAVVRSFQRICSGERVFPLNLVPHRNRVLQASNDEGRCRIERLSPREKDVLFHLVRGHSNRSIAHFLGLYEAAVKVHVKNLLRKIRVENRTQLTVWALQNLRSEPYSDA